MIKRFIEFINEANSPLQGVKLKLKELQQKHNAETDPAKRLKLKKQILNLTGNGLIAGINKSQREREKEARNFKEEYNKKYTNPPKSKNGISGSLKLGAAIGGAAIGSVVAMKLIQNRRKKRLKRYEEEYILETDPKIKAELKEKISKLRKKINNSN